MRVTSFDKGANQQPKHKEVTLMQHGTKKIIKHKVGLLNLGQELGNVARACRVMCVSRDTFYLYKVAIDDTGVEALFDRNRRKANPKNRVDEVTEEAVVTYAVEEPAHGQVRASNQLRKRGVFISPSEVRLVWLKHNLARFKDWLKALEEKMAQENLILTEAQVQALEKKKDDYIASGEIDPPPSWLSWFSGHLLYGYAKRRRSHLSANLRRYLL
jgi:hypothetical protein